MKVSMEQNNPNIHTEKIATSFAAKESTKTAGVVSGIAVDLFGNSAENEAYKGVPKTQEEIQMDAAMTDVKNNSDYRIVMSSCMSDEDFSKMLKDGVKPGSEEIENVVTMMDTIKAEMAKSGKIVAGYNDTLDRETLIEITGSETYANKLESAFREKNIPITEENVQMAKEVYERVESIDTLNDDATKYMIENGLEPTAENLYMASHSVKAGNNRQGRGYFANDMQGYYSQKAEVFNWTNLQPQMEKVIESAGYEVNDETLMDAMWIIKNGIPFTKESFDILEKVKSLDLENKEDNIFKSIATAIADGKKANEAILSNVTTIMEKAVEIQNAVNEITNKAADLCVENQQTLNIRNLMYWQKQIDINANLAMAKENTQDKFSPDIQKAHTSLEEIRLQMSVESNYRLLKAGYQIDVADLTDVVENLKVENAKRNQVLFGTSDEIVANSRKDMYNEAVEKVAKIPSLPAATVAYYIHRQTEFTLNNVYETGITLDETYKKANRSYETMMTTVRSDLGDNIKKAFRNVDDILADMELTINEENRKAVRTLGYNNMPLTDENIEKVIDANRQVSNVLDKLSPNAILKMIRNGQNPLEMQINEVEQYLLNNAETLEGTHQETYSSYLYQLEQNHQITDTERDAFIGVCRMIHQINKSDGGAIGSLLNSGATINFKNLLSAVRTKNKGHIDTFIDAESGLNTGKMEHLNSITAQINRAFENSMKTLPGYEETVAKYEKDMLSDIQNLSQVSDNIISQLLQSELPVTSDNLLAANALLNMNYQIYGKIGKKMEALDAKEELEKLKEEASALKDSFSSEENAKKGIEDFTRTAQNLLQTDTVEENAKSLDIKELSLLHKQLSLISNFSADRQYQVPVYLNGSFTTIHLTVVKDDNAAGSVNASMETDKYGTIGANFTQNHGVVEGYLVCENGFDAQTKEMFEEHFLKTLTEENLQVGKVSYVQSKDVDAKKFHGLMTKRESATDKADTKTLYTVAKAFIGAVESTL